MGYRNLPTISVACKDYIVLTKKKIIMLDCILFLLSQDNLEVRIDELETVNQKLQRRRCDTVSTFSSLSLSRCSSFRLV